MSIAVTRQLVEVVLGPPKYNGHEAIERITAPGTAAGLVWTAAGGGVQYVECARIGYGHPDRCVRVAGGVEGCEARGRGGGMGKGRRAHLDRCTSVGERSGQGCPDE